jgi:uncharacterized protein YkwD
MTLRFHSSRRCGALAATLLCALLASCGGGGDSSPSPAAGNGAGANPGASAPAVGPVAGTSVGSTCGLTNFRASLLARINQVRARGADCGADGVFGAAAPLAWNDKLTLAAEGHSQDMAAKDYFSHTSADGRTLGDRVNATGYAWSSLGENIAAGYPSVDSVMDGWIASPGHCANLMNAGFAEVGVVCVPNGGAASYPTYWTMDLGRPR